MASGEACEFALFCSACPAGTVSRDGTGCRADLRRSRFLSLRQAFRVRSAHIPRSTVVAAAGFGLVGGSGVAVNEFVLSLLVNRIGMHYRGAAAFATAA